MSAYDWASDRIYPIVYSWSRLYADAGYYFPYGQEDLYGWYKFFNQENSANTIYGYKELYRFEYYPKLYNYKQNTVTIYYAPNYGGDHDHCDDSANNLLWGLYHNDDDQTLIFQKGYYRLVEGSYSEVGAFQYIKSGRYGGAGTLDDAVFSYNYFAHKRSNENQYPGFRRE